jgi:hypothetical protein
MITEFPRVRIVWTIETIHRGVPPHVCAMGCPEYLSYDICATCYRRPSKSIDRSN